MKVLFVASANMGSISPIVLSQGSSLISSGIAVSYFGIEGKGFTGYLNNVRSIRKHVREHDPDIIHAHFSFSGFAARMAAGGKPVVVSLMGSDLAGGGGSRYLTAFFSRYVWDKTIVKSGWMANRTGNRRTVVIPNGVDLKRFVPMDDRPALKRKHGLPDGRKHILFFADPARDEKNFGLAQKAMKQGSREDVELVPIHDAPHSDMPELINAADVVLLTSRWEGSPNIVKEAMACNCPVVSTDVGDVAWLFGNENGYFIADPDPADVAQKLGQALHVRRGDDAVNGRKRLQALGLDSGTIAQRIIAEYRRLLPQKE